MIASRFLKFVENLRVHNLSLLHCRYRKIRRNSCTNMKIENRQLYSYEDAWMRNRAIDLNFRTLRKQPDSPLAYARL